MDTYKVVTAHGETEMIQADEMRINQRSVELVRDGRIVGLFNGVTSANIVEAVPQIDEADGA